LAQCESLSEFYVISSNQLFRQALTTLPIIRPLTGFFDLLYERVRYLHILPIKSFCLSFKYTHLIKTGLCGCAHREQ
jgi:hypothetical protein